MQSLFGIEKAAALDLASTAAGLQITLMANQTGSVRAVQQAEMMG